MGENLGNLGMAATAVDARHQGAKPIRFSNPGGGAAFRQAAIIDELDVETTDGRRLAEHLGLQLTGLIPCWLPTHRGVEGKDQPPALPRFGARAERFDLIEKTIKLSARRNSRSRTGMIALRLCWDRRFLGPVLAHRKNLTSGSKVVLSGNGSRGEFNQRVSHRSIAYGSYEVRFEPNLVSED